MRDPLFGPDLAVQATVLGPGGKRARLWTILDTGSSRAMIPPHVATDLGLVPRWRTTIQSFHEVENVPVAMVHLTLGELAIDRVAAAIRLMSSKEPERGLLGDSVLGHAPWEISWDRGTVTLGAGPWADTAASRSLAMHHIGPGLDEVVVHINGRPLRMVFDTGAAFSVIPERLALLMELGTRPYEGASARGVSGDVGITRILVGDLEIAGWKLPDHLFAATRTGDHPLLGLDVLARFELLIVPRERVQLRPRTADLRTTAAARIRRWPWMPSCSSPGCVRGRIEGNGPGGRIELELEVPVTDPIEIILGCGDRAEPELPVPFHRLGKQFEPPGHHLELAVRVASQGRLSVAAPDPDRRLTLPQGGGCRQLTVLDLRPPSRADPKAPDVLPFVLP
jgi:hypothetical protein